MDFRVKQYGAAEHRRLVVFAVFLLLFTSPLFADLPECSVSFNTNHLTVNEPFHIAFLFNTEEAGEIKIKKETFPASWRIIRGPFIRPFFSRIPAQSARRSGTILEYTVLPKEPGRFYLEPFVFAYKDDLIHCGPMVFFAGTRSGPTYEIPLKLRWELPRRTVYVGETAAAVLWADLLEKPVKPETVQFSFPETAIIQPAELHLQQKRISTKTGTYLSQPVAAYFVSPLESGELRVPSVSVTAGGRENKGPALVLDVAPLPGKAANSQAIGSMSFHSSVQREDSGYVTVKERFSGKGNFPFVDFPAPVTGNLELVRTHGEDQFSFSAEGYHGSRSRYYEYVPAQKSSEGTVSIPDVRIFNPETGNVKTFPGGKPVIIPASASGPGQAENQSSVQQLPENPWPALLSSAKRPVFRFYTRRWFYFLFLFTLAGTAVLTVMFRKRPGKGRIFLPGILLSLFLFLFGFAGTGDIGGYSFSGTAGTPSGNIFLEAYRDFEDGDYARALFLLRQAHRMYPMNADVVHAVAFTEKNADISDQIPASRILPPDLWMFLSLFVLLAMVVIGFLKFFRKKQIFLLFMLLVIILIVTTGLFTYTALSVSQKAGVVGSAGADLRKIPHQDSTVIKDLAAGTTVSVLGEADGFFQVRTGTAFTGWIDKDKIQALF